MLFTDEEARHRYHTSSTLLQVVCQMVESALVKYHLQLELVDVEEQENMWVALLVVGSENYEDSPELAQSLEHEVTIINKQFKRYDEKKTVTVECGRVGLLTVRVAASTDYSLAN